MAVRTALGYSGLVGTVVLYEVNGKQYMRAKPRSRKKKPDKATKARNTLFGDVSTYGTSLIGAMKGKLLFPFTLETYNRQRGWMWNEYAAHKDDDVWELGAKNNQMSQLNTDTDLRDFLEAAFTVTDEGKGLVSIGIPAINPAKQIKAPARTVKVNMKMMVLSRPFTGAATDHYLDMEAYTFDYGNTLLPGKTFTIDTRPMRGTATGNIALVAIALEFETTDSGKGIYNMEKRWLPAAIIAMGRLK
jgi:hypothetical protein